MSKKAKTLAEAIASEFHNVYGSGIGTYKKKWNELDDNGKWATLLEARRASAEMVKAAENDRNRHDEELRKHCDELKAKLDVANNKLEYGAAPNLYLDVTYKTIDLDDEIESYPAITVQERLAVKHYYFGDTIEDGWRMHVLYYVDSSFVSQEIQQVERIALVLPNGEQDVIFELASGADEA